MSNGKCKKCTKTVYATERVDAAGSIWHKLCFKCCDDKCNLTLALTTFKAHDGLVYCAKHVPMPKHTEIADSVSTVTALSTPKKPAEGLGWAQKGTGDAHRLDAGAMSIQHALNAPKRKAEGLDKVYRGE